MKKSELDKKEVISLENVEKLTLLPVNVCQFAVLNQQGAFSLFLFLVSYLLKGQREEEKS